MLINAFLEPCLINFEPPLVGPIHHFSRLLVSPLPEGSASGNDNETGNANYAKPMIGTGFSKVAAS